MDHLFQIGEISSFLMCQHRRFGIGKIKGSYIPKSKVKIIIVNTPLKI